MGYMTNRFKVKGTVKFEVEDVFGKNLETVKQELQDHQAVLEHIECAPNDGIIEFTITEIQDLGLCDMDEFYESQ